MGSVSQFITFSQYNHLGLIILNRPQALNAMDHAMCAAMLAQLEAWRDDSTIAAVIITGSGDKAFCAGGDIRAIVTNGQDYARQFFAAEYALNAAIRHYSKPYLAIMNGITMGGGVGVSVHGSHRIATERTIWAMPEVAIGLYPDIGSSYFMPRLPGWIGTYLALTGARLQAADLLYSGIATHYMASDDVTDFIAYCADNSIEKGLAAFSLPSSVTATLPDLRPIIDRCFSYNTVEAILDALDGEHTAWGATTAATIRMMSPTSLKITLKQMRLGKTLDFDQAMAMEAGMTEAFIDHSLDFREGVRAMLIDKDKSPRWQPLTLSGVDDATIDKYFRKDVK